MVTTSGLLDVSILEFAEKDRMPPTKSLENLLLILAPKGASEPTISGVIHQYDVAKRDQLVANLYGKRKNLSRKLFDYLLDNFANPFPFKLDISKFYDLISIASGNHKEDNVSSRLFRNRYHLLRRELEKMDSLNETEFRFIDGLLTIYNRENELLERNRITDSTSKARGNFMDYYTNHFLKKFKFDQGREGNALNVDANVQYSTIAPDNKEARSPNKVLSGIGQYASRFAESIYRGLSLLFLPHSLSQRYASLFLASNIFLGTIGFNSKQAYADTTQGRPAAITEEYDLQNPSQNNPLVSFDIDKSQADKYYIIKVEKDKTIAKYLNQYFSGSPIDSTRRNVRSGKFKRADYDRSLGVFMHDNPHISDPECIYPGQEIRFRKDLLESIGINPLEGRNLNETPNKVNDSTQIPNTQVSSEPRDVDRARTRSDRASHTGPYETDDPMPSKHNARQPSGSYRPRSVDNGTGSGSIGDLLRDRLMSALETKERPIIFTGPDGTVYNTSSWSESSRERIRELIQGGNRSIDIFLLKNLPELRNYNGPEFNPDKVKTSGRYNNEFFRVRYNKKKQIITIELKGDQRKGIKDYEILKREATELLNRYLVFSPSGYVDPVIPQISLSEMGVDLGRLPTNLSEDQRYWLTPGGRNSWQNQERVNGYLYSSDGTRKMEIAFGPGFYREGPVISKDIGVFTQGNQGLNEVRVRIGGNDFNVVYDNAAMNGTIRLENASNRF